MAIEVKVPSLGESISSGILASWKVKDGDAIDRDQVLYELETDKITSEGIAESAGTISLKVEEGAEVEVGQVVAVIDPDGNGKADSSSARAKDKKMDGEDDKSKASSKSEDEEPSDSSDKKSTDEEKPSSRHKSSDTSESAEPSGATDQATALPPSVRRLAAESGVDPSSVEGSGKGGRVTKGDMLAAIEKQEKAEEDEKSRSREKQAADKDDAPASERDAPKPSQAPADERESRRKLSPLRQKVAQRLVSSQQQMATLTTFNEVDMTAVRTLRARHQEDFTARHGIKLGFMSFFIKAVVQALQAVPALNARIEGDTLVEQRYYDIGVAVSTDRGLMVPVVRDCDQLSFAAIEERLAAFAKKAREGKITLDDLQGGVFTISNGGVFGSLLSTPIINPPQSGILGMHTIQDRPVAVDGKVEIRPMMYLALTYDHRLVDGREAVTFLGHVKRAVEDPARLLFGL
ncbi:MAG: 2-oxoglutarate dehydrogenase complex dihydrolipoyllysine-residue succinyltransferase [Puniceicoccaceae bacterium]|nr:MAG: 2-oxoglutarate dehydrogenase complex dihydrolipoyllysine-residue succinyltransferase [Puniceicoccaceae bacterium]